MGCQDVQAAQGQGWGAGDLPMGVYSDSPLVTKRSYKKVVILLSVPHAIYATHAVNSRRGS